MLTITFYKNCIVNDTYSEVFDLWTKDSNGKTAFDRYLESLESLSITLEDCYLTDSGTLDIDLSIYSGQNVQRFETFNYMRLVDDAGNLPRYAFINEFRVINSLGVFTYVVDAWHTYASLMTLRSSVLTHSRALEYEKFKITHYRRPTAPKSTQIYKPVLNAYPLPDNVPSALEDKVNIIVEFTAYQPSKGDIVENRTTFMALVTPVSATSMGPAYSVNEVQEVVEQLIAGVPINKLILGNLQNHYDNISFTINNVYLIPEKFGFISYGWVQPNREYQYRTEEQYTYIQYDKDGTPAVGAVREGFRFWNISQSYVNTLNIKDVPFATLTHDYIYNVQFLNEFIFGNLSHQISLGGDSLTPYVDIITSIGLNNFTLKLRVDNKFIDITDDYRYIPSITTISAEALESQRISYQLGILNNQIQQAQQAISIAGTVLKGGADIATGNYTGGASAVGSLASEGLSMAGLVAQRKALETPLTASTSAQYSNSTTMENVRLGLIAFVIDVSESTATKQGNTDNLTLVFNSENMLGYACEVVCDNSVFYPKNLPSPQYNVVQFGAVRVTGIFSQRIAELLTQILMNGTQIWYTEDITENIAYDI